ncbi:50S ribosomal protein L25/general stress protein Ctc [Candidatus Kinetoplastibacterium sorsogonicusi]|nr:50S ribosomal protein L25/general stress protein Ctc [Candidatus Kinetoplastibacterium sorsogonicusi]
MKFNAVIRNVHGTSASRRLRHAGLIPGIVYGSNHKPLNIELDHNEIYHLLRKEEFHSSILEMFFDDNKSESVLLRAVQWHPYKQQVLHVDFQRVNANKNINTKVPLHFINEDISPAVKLHSGIINHVVTELDISCLPSLLPKFIEVDLSNIDIGEVVHLSKIKLPEGIVYNAHSSDIDPLIVSAVSIEEKDNEAEIDNKNETI